VLRDVLESLLPALLPAEFFPQIYSRLADACGMVECAAETLAWELTPLEVTRKTGTQAPRPIQVLLVEDDAETAELVQLGLTEGEDGPFRSEWASNLVEAMIRLAQPGIDVIVLDLGLPELSGPMSYRAVDSAAGRKLPIVILTSDDSGGSRTVTLQLGAADYLLKHESSPGLLRRALRSALLRGRPRKPGGGEC